MERDFNLDDLREQCEISLTTGSYWVLFDRQLIADSVGNVVVVPRDDIRWTCYYCATTTQGRLIVSSAAEPDRVMRVDVVCEFCCTVREAGRDPLRALCAAYGGSLRDRINHWKALRERRRAEHIMIINSLRLALPQWVADAATGAVQVGQTNARGIRRLSTASSAPPPVHSSATVVDGWVSDIDQVLAAAEADRED